MTARQSTGTEFCIDKITHNCTLLVFFFLQKYMETEIMHIIYVCITLYTILSVFILQTPLLITVKAEKSLFIRLLFSDKFCDSFSI